MASETRSTDDVGPDVECEGGAETRFTASSDASSVSPAQVTLRVPSLADVLLHTSPTEEAVRTSELHPPEAQEGDSTLRRRRTPDRTQSQLNIENMHPPTESPPVLAPPAAPPPNRAPGDVRPSADASQAAAPPSSASLAGGDAPPRRAKEAYIASLDVGTTSVRCVVLDRRLRQRGTCRRDVTLLYPQPDRVEIDPDQLFTAVCDVINGAVRDAGLSADQITTLGMSVQRSSFINWSRETGRPYHNIIAWSDRRAAALVADWNSSWRFRLCGLGARFVHMITRQPRFLAVAVLRLMNQQVTMRLLWCMQNVPALAAGIASGTAMFGTVETYLLYRLTSGRLHVSDITNAAATGFYDPYLKCWSWFPYALFGAPVASTLPEVVPNTYSFGRTAPGVLDAELPIGCVIGDQSASMFGSGCFQRGDVAVTLGTGSFMDINTGGAPHTSVRGLYPCVAWQRGDETVFMAEGSAGDTANCVLWGRKVGLYAQVEDTSALARTAADAGGVRFVPAFSGLAAPVNDFRAAAGFIGVTADTSAAQLTLALLQAVVFRLRQLHGSMLAEVAYPLRQVRVAGGVANNDTVCQMAADVLGVRLERGRDVETSARGAAALAGLAAGIWRHDAEVDALRQVEKVFEPDPVKGHQLREEMKDWERALERFGKWYAEDVQ